MNAHHKKSTYKPPAPVQRSRYSSGTALVADTASPEGARPRLARLAKAVERLPFGWQLDAIIPSLGSTNAQHFTKELQDAVDEACVSYLCEGVNLADLLEPEFLNSFVRSGSLVALSLDDSEGEDVVAIDGRGRLVLSVSKDTYELLGLPGRASAYGTFRQRFIIELSLRDASFRAGKPGFERTKRALRNWPRQTDLLDELRGHGAPKGEGKTFDLVMAFTDADGNSKPLTLPSPLRAHRLPATLHTSTLRSVLIPRPSSLPAPQPAPAKKQRTSSGAFRAPPREADDPAVFWEAYREWAGLVRLGATDKLRAAAGGEEEGDDAWGVEGDKCDEGEVAVLSWSGLLHPKALSRALQSVLSNLSLSPPLPFLDLSLTPFAHAPLSHLSAASPPVVGTSKRPNGKKRKRGRGRGEEEEADRARVEDEGGWACVLRPREEGQGAIEWHLWEGQ
ncbi:Proteophosphoglycan ppg4 [Rhodotorula diobovata]|uniref:Proteophosphoglycan ppg4 n=1 Tax=Rhodotorula diobovata TaxID=5288 RepID=A0A5C5G4L1_9BASI|nr:Proteophosphoglycan ppg4 [Rhodotorula diobovata]